MILIDLKDEFIHLLFQAYKLDISITKRKLSKMSVFSYCMLCDSAFSNFGSTACSRNWLTTQIQKIKKIDECDNQQVILYVETHAAEWDYYDDPNLDTFNEVNNFTQKIRNADYDGELTGIYKEGDFDGRCYDDYQSFYITCIIETFSKLIKTHCFDELPFEKDLLKGLQYVDPTKLQQNFMLKISENVNSPKWHKKMLDAYSQSFHRW